MPRARAIQIYLKPGIEEDDVLLDLWELCKTRSRPQVVFRRMLQAGLKTLMENGELPKGIASRIMVDALPALPVIPQKTVAPKEYDKPENIQTDVQKPQASEPRSEDPVNKPDSVESDAPKNFLTNKPQLTEEKISTIIDNGADTSNQVAVPKKRIGNIM